MLITESGNILAEYQNGNVAVTLLRDGTKVRVYEGRSETLFPESMDIKITDYCVGAGCAYCFESSTGRGQHGELKFIQSILSQMKSGTEIAIGGGNPFSHPDLEAILTHARNVGVVANITINSAHIRGEVDRIRRFRSDRLIYGLGISYRPDKLNEIIEIADRNSVIHIIAGVHKIEDVMKLPAGSKILILGYKDYGFGVRFKAFNPVWNDLKKFSFHLSRLFTRHHMCFDNLALQQLRVSERLDSSVWQSHYMGEDGNHTMYVDCVKREYARTSTAERVVCEDRSLSDMFKSIQTV